MRFGRHLNPPVLGAAVLVVLLLVAAELYYWAEVGRPGTLTVLSPNGGESLKVDERHVLRWRWDGKAKAGNFLVATLSGERGSQVVMAQPALGLKPERGWVVPAYFTNIDTPMLLPSGEYVMRLTLYDREFCMDMYCPPGKARYDQAAVLASDESDATFHVTNPSRP